MPQLRIEHTVGSSSFPTRFLVQACGSEVRVSEGYSTTLVLISLLVGFGLVWLPVFQGHGGAFLQSCLGFLALLALGFPRWRLQSSLRPLQ